MKTINLNQMFKCNVYLGHRIKNVNPQMRSFLFGKYEGIAIINIIKTYIQLLKITMFLRKVIAMDGYERVLFVGTNKFIAPIIAKTAENSSCFYVNEQWKGGFLTNFRSMKRNKNFFKFNANETVSQEIYNPMTFDQSSPFSPKGKTSLKKKKKTSSPSKKLKTRLKKTFASLIRKKPKTLSSLKLKKSKTFLKNSSGFVMRKKPKTYLKNSFPSLMKQKPKLSLRKISKRLKTPKVPLKKTSSSLIAEKPQISIPIQNRFFFSLKRYYMLALQGKTFYKKTFLIPKKLKTSLKKKIFSSLMPKKLKTSFTKKISSSSMPKKLKTPLKKKTYGSLIPKKLKAKKPKDFQNIFSTLNFSFKQIQEKQRKIISFSSLQLKDFKKKTIRLLPKKIKEKQIKILRFSPRQLKNKQGKTVRLLPKKIKNKQGNNVNLSFQWLKNEQGKTIRLIPKPLKTQQGKTISFSPRMLKDKKGKTLKKISHPNIRVLPIRPFVLKKNFHFSKKNLKTEPIMLKKPMSFPSPKETVNLKQTQLTSIDSTMLKRQTKAKKFLNKQETQKKKKIKTFHFNEFVVPQQEKCPIVLINSNQTQALNYKKKILVNKKNKKQTLVWSFKKKLTQKTINNLNEKLVLRSEKKPTQKTTEKKNKKTISPSFQNFQTPKFYLLPQIVIIVGQQKEIKVVKECKKLNILTISLLDSDGDPSLANLIIPGNDDHPDSVECVLKSLGESISIGKLIYNERKKYEKKKEVSPDLSLHSITQKQKLFQMPDFKNR